MQSKIMIASTVVASMLALGLCDTIKSKIPFIGGGDEEKVAAEEKADEAGEEKAEKPETREEEASSGTAEASAEEETGEDEAETVAEAGDEAEEEPEKKEEPAAPAEPPSFDGDIPKSIKTAAKIKTVLVLAHPENRKKYTAFAKKAQPDIKMCHKQVLAKDSSVEGKIKFRITVSAEGVATKVEIEKNNSGSDELAECGAQVFKAHSWPKRKDGDERVLAIPIMFEKPSKGPELLI